MKCSICSVEIPQGMDYCPACGKSCLSEDIQPLCEKPEKSKKTLIMIPVALVVGFVSFAAFVIVCLTVIFGIVRHSSGNEDEGTTGFYEDAYSEDAIREAIADAEEYLSSGNYDAALSVIAQAEQSFGYNDLLSQKRNQIIKSKHLSALASYENAGDYKGGLIYINSNIQDFTDAELIARKTVFSDFFRSEVLFQAEDLYVGGKADEAAQLIKDALGVLSGDSALIAKYTEYSGKNDISEPDEPQNKVPSTKAEIIGFYSQAVNRVEYEEAAGFTMQEWQNIDSLETGNKTADKLIITGLSAFMTKEEDVEPITFTRGQEEIIEEFPDWYLTDISFVESAECVVDADGNYRITMTMADEDTPTADSNLEAVTETVLIWEKIEDLLLNDTMVKTVLTHYEDVSVYYSDFTINATITPEGEIIFLEHIAGIDAFIGKAEIAKMFTIENKTGHMWHYCKYYDFTY